MCQYLLFFQVKFLLQRGADIHKRTGDNLSRLCLGLLQNKEEMIELLLRNGARVNEIAYETSTALHLACRKYNWAMLEALVRYGADLNALNGDGKTPMTLDQYYDEEMFIKELVELKIKGLTICDQNLEYIQKNDEVKKLFDDYLSEMQRMRHKFYNDYSLLDVYLMRKQPMKLIQLTKNEELVEAFKSCWNHKMFKNFGEELDEIFEQACSKRDQLLFQEKTLRSIFKDYLPELVTCKIAYYVVDNKPFERKKKYLFF